MVKKKKAQKIYPKFRHIDIRIFYDAMNKAHKNAEDYYYEAELLYEMRRYGHSIALTTFGIEELGKSVGYHLLLSIKFNPELLRGEIQLDPDKIIEIIHSKHERKQGLSLLFAFFTHIAFKDHLILAEDIYRDRKNRMSIKDISDRMTKIQKEAQRKTKHMKRWIKDLKFIEQLHNKRMDGMYVEIKGYPIELSHPKSINANVSYKALTILDRYLDLLFFIPNIIWDDKVYQIMENKHELIFGNT